jgi:hypothetical protein
MRYNGGARLTQLLSLVEIVEYLAVEVARDLRRRVKSVPRRRGATLRPGIDAPLWLALVSLVEPHLRRRGAKALLAHELGLHRSQVSKFFGAKSAMPDAERTLELIAWLSRQREAAGPGKITH